MKSNAETEFRGRSKNERTARVIDSLRKKYKLKDLLEYAGMAKSTFMYWQKRFNRENPDKDIEEKILEIRSVHKDYGYRRIHAELRNQGYCINKKRVQRIIQ